MKELYSIYHHEIPDFINDFLNCKALKRLEDIGMNCGCEYTSFPVFKDLEKYSRYQHSIGCALIVYHFTKSKEQALAALFHDISSPVFAHTIDFMYGDYTKQTITENNTEKFIKEDEEIVSLLSKYNIDINDVIDYHKYPIADNDSPKLSSDRLEYSLGNMVNYGICSLEDVKKYYDNLTVSKNEFDEVELVFKDQDIACLFSIHTLLTSKIYVSDEDRYSMQILAELIKYAIDNNVLTIDDLYTTESSVISKLKSNPITLEKWNNYTSMESAQETTKDDPSIDKRIVLAKKRYIDPFVLNKDRLSKLMDKFSDELDEFKELDFGKYIKI